MFVWGNNGNRSKFLAGVAMGMRLKLVGMGRNGKAGNHSRTPLLCSCRRLNEARHETMSAAPPGADKTLHVQ